MFSTDGFSSVTFIDIFTFAAIWRGAREFKTFVAGAFEPIFFIGANMITVMTTNFALIEIFEHFHFVFRPIGSENFRSEKGIRKPSSSTKVDLHLNPSPAKSCLHLQVKEPSVFKHLAFLSQGLAEKILLHQIL